MLVAVVLGVVGGGGARGVWGWYISFLCFVFWEKRGREDEEEEEDEDKNEEEDEDKNEAEDEDKNEDEDEDKNKNKNKTNQDETIGFVR